MKRLVEQVKALPPQEREELLAWLAEDELQRADAWDEQMERDAQPSGRLRPILERVRQDIAGGRTKPLDELLDHP